MYIHNATYYVTRCSFELCLRLFLRETCGILAERKQNKIPPNPNEHTHTHMNRSWCTWVGEAWAKRVLLAGLLREPCGNIARHVCQSSWTMDPQITATMTDYQS